MISTTPGAATIATLEGAPAGLTLTARLVDGDETLATSVIVTPKLDAGGDELNAYEAAFLAPGADDLPVVLEWLEGATLVASELVVSNGTVPPSSVGDPYFTVAEARQLSPLNDEAKYPDEAIEAMRWTVEQAIEQRCGVAFVPRIATEVVDGTGGTDIMLRWPRPLSVTSATVDGSAYTDAVLYPTGIAYSSSRWTTGRSNVEITYTHGYETVPGEIKQAALKMTRDWLVEGPIDSRMTSMSNDDGTFSLATPGVRGSSFGIPFVDAVIQAYSLQVAVA